MPVLGGTQRRMGICASAVPSTASPAWSPDKSHIVYTVGAEMRVARSDGSESARVLAAPGDVFSARWSPTAGDSLFVIDPETFTSRFGRLTALAGTRTPASWLDRCPEPVLRHLDTRRQTVSSRPRPFCGRCRSRASSGGSEQACAAHFGPIIFSGVMPAGTASVFWRRATSARAGCPLRRRRRSVSCPISASSGESVALSNDGAWVATSPSGGRAGRSRTDGTTAALTFSPRRPPCLLVA